MVPYMGGIPRGQKALLVRWTSCLPSVHWMGVLLRELWYDGRSVQRREAGLLQPLRSRMRY